MSESLPQPADLLQHLWSMCDGTASDAELVQLEKWAASDMSVRRTYVQFMAMHVELQWTTRGDQAADAAIAQLPFLTGLKDAAFQPTPLTTPFSSWRRKCASPVAVTAALACLLYGVFVCLAWNLRPDRLPNVAENNPETVAVVRDTNDVQWSKDASSKSAVSSILPGEPLKISSGTIELELKAGAKLLVEGPAEWSVDSANSVWLRAGKLVARVPEQAIGFTVETPTAKVVDLGTEFAIEADERGATEVQVLKGKIELHPGGRTSDSSRVQQPLTLSAGSAVRVEPAQAGGIPVVRKIAAATNRFTNPSEPNKSRHIAVFGAIASSEYAPVHRATNLINGSGLKEDRHTNVPRDTMWLSRPGKVKNEFVLFDLGRPCRLDSMKVWNYNENYGNERDINGNRLYTPRGVKQADIYVSNSGNPDPISQPNEWRLIAADRQFAEADGTADYATPDVIAMEGVEARFVAIVIDSSYGLQIVAKDDLVNKVVGLSEVQFFGKPLNKPSPSGTRP